MFRSALRSGRCLVPADGFYEWQAVAGRKAKQPIYFRLRDGELFAFAGLSALDADDHPTCALVTTRPNELVLPIHNRMPVILTPDCETLWLDPEVPVNVALACLQPYPAELMEAYPVGREVGNPSNDGPRLVAPRPPSDEFTAHTR